MKPMNKKIVVVFQPLFGYIRKSKKNLFSLIFLCLKSFYGDCSCFYRSEKDRVIVPKDKKQMFQVILSLFFP